MGAREKLGMEAAAGSMDLKSVELVGSAGLGTANNVQRRWQNRPGGKVGSFRVGG